MSIILSIDLGTTGLKVGLVNINGHLEASAGAEYSIETPKPGYAEQDAWLRLLKIDFTLEPLRSDPRYFDLLRRMNLEP